MYISSKPTFKLAPFCLSVSGINEYIVECMSSKTFTVLCMCVCFASVFVHDQVNLKNCICLTFSSTCEGRRSVRAYLIQTETHIQPQKYKHALSLSLALSPIPFQHCPWFVVLWIMDSQTHKICAD